MHGSTKRLLDFAKEVTRESPEAVTDFASLAARLEVSSAVMTNWKSRGVSKEGAIHAEALFGCAAHWVLTGEGPKASDQTKRALVIADALRNLGPQSKLALDVMRMQLRGQHMASEKLAEYLAALDSLEQEAQGKH